MQQSGRLQNDGGTKDTCRAHEQRAQAGDDPIPGTQVGRTLAPAIEDEQLMPGQHGLGDNGTESSRPRQSGQGDYQMNEYDSEVAHSGNGINTSQTTALWPIWQFAIDTCQYNAPLFSCPTWAQWVTVVLGSELNSNPSRGVGVNGDLVAGVLSVTDIGAATFWIKSPLKVLPLLKLHFLTLPVQ